MGNFISSLENPGPVVGFLYYYDMGLLYWAFSLFKGVVSICDFFLDNLIGYTITKGTRKEREKAKDYELSAQIATIMGRGSYTIVMNHQLHHYCLKHEKYVHPRYILEHDNITLQGMTPSHAFFCVSEPEVNVYDCDTGPFLWVKQYLTAKKLIIIPHSTLHRLAAEVGDPTDRRLTLINMTARCGSTLICQMINTVPNVRTISEPWCFNHLHYHYVGGRIEYGEFRRLVRSCMRLQCKKENNSKIKHIMIKICALTCPIFPMLNEMYPDANFMFNTRLLKGTMASYAQIVHHIPITAKLVELFTGTIFSEQATFPYDDPAWWKYYHRHISHFRTVQEGLLLCYGGQMTDYLRHKDIYDLAIFFEDVMANPERELKKIFDLMEIEYIFLPKALETLSKDSQRGTFGTRGKRPKISDKEFAFLDSYLRSCDVDERITCEMDLDTLKKVVL